MTKLTEIVRSHIQKFEDTSIEIVPGWSFNQKKTLKRIELYYNSKFETGTYDGLDYLDSENSKKFFYNLNQFPCDVEAKGTDIDTKDFVMIPEDPNDETPVYFLSKEFSQWAKEKKWGQLLNEIIWNRPKYGVVVVKKVKNRMEFVNLHNLINDQSVKYLWQGPVFEKMVMTAQDLREMPWNKKAIERIIGLYSNDNKENEIVVYSGYLWAKPNEIYEKEKSKELAKELAYYFCVVSGIEKQTFDQKGNLTFDGSEVLFADSVQAPSKDNLGDFPYRETHRRRIPGRWLSVGKVEELIDPQIRMNELENLKAKALALTSRVLLQSTDDTVAKNVLTDLVNGEILRVKSPLTEIPMRVNDLSAFNQEEQRWDKNVQERSFTFEAETGESLPSGSPFRLGALLSQQSGKFFGLMREDIALFLIDVFFELIIPEFKKDKKKKHIVSLPKDEKDREDILNSYIEALLSDKINQLSFQDAILFDVEAERQNLKDKLNKRIFVEMPDSWYNDIKFKMKLVITDEQINVSQKLETLSNILQIVMGNPQALQDENVRKILSASLEYAGVNPATLGIGRPPQPSLQPPQQPQTRGTPQSLANLPVPANTPQFPQLNA